MFVNHFIKKITEAVQTHPAPPDFILSRSQINQLFNKAQDILTQTSSNAFSKQGLHGNKLSQINGQGMDYNESRLYSSSDDIRSINWKQSARSNELIVNRYIEEQEPVDYIIIDMRAGMYFGTQAQPKISVAIKLLISELTRSLKDGHTVKLLTVNDATHRLKVIQDIKTAIETITLISIFDDEYLNHSNIDISSVLKSLIVMKPEFGTISVLSDFNDISKKTKYLFQKLAQKNNLKLYRIQDQAELSLPEYFPIEYQAISGDENITINTQSDYLRFKDSIHAHSQYIDDILESCGQNYFKFSTKELDQSLLNLKAVF